jgi:hypothetical protein
MRPKDILAKNSNKHLALNLKVSNFNQKPVALAGAPFRKLFTYNGSRSTCFVQRFHARGELKERKVSNNIFRKWITVHTALSSR